MNKWHKPQTIENAENAVGYFVVVSAVTCGVAFVLAGMVSFLFWPHAKKVAEEWAKEECDKNKQWSEKDRKDCVKGTKIGVAICLGVWFIVAWAFFVFAQLTYH